ncbi:hypothetical protein HFN89_05420 [Rhizobium laguerreae]|nr:hypothetical protein [Rhizobium laguerreae]
MRFQVHDIDALKRKAKFLKKYLHHQLIGRPDIQLGAIQRMFATALGYEDWAELNLVSKRQQQGQGNTEWPHAAMAQLSTALRRLAAVDACLAEALVFRIGFTPDGDLKTPTVKRGLPCLLYADVLVDRLLKVDAASRDASIVRRALSDVYERLADGMHEEAGASGWERRKAALEWLDAVFIWMGWEIDSWRDRGERYRLPVAYIPVERITKIAEQLPSTGLMAMSGCFGSGRSTTPRLLSLAMRPGRTTMFHMASELLLRGVVTPCGIYRGELRGFDTFAAVVKEAEDKLVMFQLGAASPGSAYSLMRWNAKSVLPDIWRDWFGTNFIGGFHHDWDREGRPALVQSIQHWWAKDADISRPSREFPDGYVTLRALASI